MLKWKWNLATYSTESISFHFISFHESKKSNLFQGNTQGTRKTQNRKCTAKWGDCTFRGWRVRRKTLFHRLPAGEERRAGAAPCAAPPGPHLHLCSARAHQARSSSQTAGWTVCTEALRARGLLWLPIPPSSLCRWSWPVWPFAAGGTSCKLFGLLLLPCLLLSCAGCCWSAHRTPVSQYVHVILTVCNLKYRRKQTPRIKIQTTECNICRDEGFLVGGYTESSAVWVVGMVLRKLFMCLTLYWEQNH